MIIRNINRELLRNMSIGDLLRLESEMYDYIDGHIYNDEQRCIVLRELFKRFYKEL